MLQLQLLNLNGYFTTSVLHCTVREDDLQVCQYWVLLSTEVLTASSRQVAVAPPPALSHPAGGDQWRERSGSGHWWGRSEVNWKYFKRKNISTIKYASRDYVNDPDDDNDGILDIHDDDDDGDGSTPGCIFIYRVIWIISRYSWCSRRGLAWRLVTPSMIIFIIL